MRKAAAALVVALSTALIWPVAVSAHTDFESSTPADGATVDGPLTVVVVDFTNPARMVGDGFQLLDPSGQIRTPSSIDPTDGTSFVLAFDPPLSAGTYGVRWRVQAGDAHPAEGSFSFAVTEAPVTTVAPSTSTTTTTAPATTSAVTTSPVTTAGTTTLVTTTAASSATEPAATAPPVSSLAEPAPPSPAAGNSRVSLDDFLAGDGSSDDGRTAGGLGRTLSSLGLILGLGTLAALVWVVRGDRHELGTLVRLVRVAGLAVVVGGVLELAALAASQSSAVLDLLDTKAGVAAGLKVLGGLVAVASFGPTAGRIVAPSRTLSAAVGTDVSTDHGVVRDAAGRDRWVPAGRGWFGLAGFAGMLVAFWFDGHTVSRGPWAVHTAANSVHLGAAAVWAGGVFAMTVMVWMRRRTLTQTGLGPMVVRFSTPATVSLVALTAAGSVMAAVILDEPGDLFDSDWGRLFLAKTTAVVLAAGLGAFNHFRLRPALEQRPDDPALAKELRTSLVAESAVLVVVIVLTAWLVAAAT